MYRLRRGGGFFNAHAIAAYVNRDAGPVHFARCMPEHTGPMYDIVRADTGTWSFVGEVWGCVGGVPTGTVAPGDSLVVRVALGGSESSNADPPITMAERTGLFRIVFAFCAGATADSVDCVPTPEEHRRSNVFRIAPPS